jgi:TatA/E family protein of Tat protein translocase
MGIENPVHLIFLGAVALIVLGPRRLPELARTLGKGIREFRDAINVGEVTPAEDQESQTQLLPPAPLHVEQHGQTPGPAESTAEGPDGSARGVIDAEPARGQVREEDRGLA